MTTKQASSDTQVPAVFVCLGVVLFPYVIGRLYAYGVCNSGYIPVDLAMLAGVAGANGWLVAKASIRLGLSSNSLRSVVAMLAGLMCLYANWSGCAAIHVPAAGMATLNPAFLLEYARQLHANNLEVQLGSNLVTFSGWSLIGLWVAEGAVFVVGSAYAAQRIFALDAPSRCERCGNWRTDEIGALRYVMPPDQGEFDELVADFSEGRFDCFGDLDDGTYDDDPHLRVDVAQCSAKCGAEGIARLTLISYTSETSEMPLCEAEVSLAQATVLSSLMDAQTARLMASEEEQMRTEAEREDE